jgi:hypothetical protein
MQNDSNFLTVLPTKIIPRPPEVDYTFFWRVLERPLRCKKSGK